MQTPDWRNDHTKRTREPRTRVLMRCKLCDELVEITPAITSADLVESQRTRKPLSKCASVVAAKCGCGNVSALRGGDS